MSRKPVTYTQPPANLPVCWLCDKKLYAGGRAYVLVESDDGHKHPAHKRCAYLDERANA